MLEAHQSGLVGKTTGAIEAAGGVAFAEVTTGPDRRGTPVPGGHGARVAGSPTCPPSGPISLAQRSRRSGDHWCCARWRVGMWAGCSGEPGPVLARVCGDPLLPEVEFDQRFTGVQVQLLAHVLVRHRVIMVPILDMVVDIDGHRFDDDVAVGVPG